MMTGPAPVVQSIAFGDDSVQVAYLMPDAVHRDSGIIETRIIDIPHAVLESGLFNALNTAVLDILDEARQIQRQPIESLRAQ